LALLAGLGGAQEPSATVALAPLAAPQAQASSAALGSAAPNKHELHSQALHSALQDQDPAAPARPAFLGTSICGKQLHLGDTPPEVRALRVIQLRFEGSVGSPRRGVRTREAAEQFCNELRQRISAGEDFGALARQYSDASNAVNGGLVGVVPPGVLGDGLDPWLFAAEHQELSPVVFTAAGYMLAQRIQERVGARVIRVEDRGPEGWARARDLLKRLEEGADFSQLAGELSEDEESKARGGAFAIFERGSGDSMIKAAAFETPIGQIAGPIDTPLGLFLVQAVAPDSLPPELFKNPWARFSAILISFDQATVEFDPLPGRNAATAEVVAQQVTERLRRGEDFAELAAQVNDDPGQGRERRGDVGWFHRQQPGLQSFLRANFDAEVGTVLDPVPLNVGYVILMRTR
jgi:parvulin-like peptidyl-prolyl isomerase